MMIEWKVELTRTPSQIQIEVERLQSRGFEIVKIDVFSDGSGCVTAKRSARCSDLENFVMKVKNFTSMHEHIEKEFKARLQAADAETKKRMIRDAEMGGDCSLVAIMVSLKRLNFEASFIHEGGKVEDIPKDMRA